MSVEKGVRARGLALALTWLAACGATGNPARAELEPAALPPAPAERAADGSPAGTDPGAASPAAPAESGTAATARAPETATGASATDAETAPAATPGAEPGTVIGWVAGQPIDAREFLSRAWLRDSDRAREILDHLVIERLAILEAERLGLSIGQEPVDARLERAERALEQRLQEAGSRLTPDEHIRRVLGLDPAFYRRQLRHETIAQLIAERVVRAWAMEEERCRVRVLELPDRAAVDNVRSELDQGASFDALADRIEAETAVPGAAEPGEPREPTRLTLVRAESSPLARLALATPVGQVGGPLEDQSRFLLIRVEERLPPVPGLWKEVGPEVEASLRETPVDDFEFVQWRAHMARRYPIDLAAFFEAVGTTR